MLTLCDTLFNSIRDISLFGHTIVFALKMIMISYFNNFVGHKKEVMSI